MAWRVVQPQQRGVWRRAPAIGWMVRLLLWWTRDSPVFVLPCCLAGPADDPAVAVGGPAGRWPVSGTHCATACSSVRHVQGGTTRLASLAKSRHVQLMRVAALQ